MDDNTSVDKELPRWLVIPFIALMLIILIYGVYREIKYPRDYSDLVLNKTPELNLTPEQMQAIERGLIENNCTKKNDSSWYCPLLDINKTRENSE